MSRFAGFTAGNGLIHVAIDSDKSFRQFSLSDCGMFLIATERMSGLTRVFIERQPLAAWEVWMDLGRARDFSLRANASEFALADQEAQMIRRIELNNRAPLPSLSMSNPTAVAYSPDGRRIAAGNSYGKVAVWNLETDGPARFEQGWSLSKSAITRVFFSSNTLIVTTEDGACLRTPFIEPLPHDVGLYSSGPALVAGDGYPISLLCQAFDAQGFLECFGLEGGLLVSRHLASALTWYFQTEAHTCIKALKFWEEKKQLIVMGNRRVEIWKTDLVLMSEKWMVSGDLSKLGRMSLMVTRLAEIVDPPEAELVPLSITMLKGKPVIVWEKKEIKAD